MINYCNGNDTFLPVWQYNGLSPCLYYTVQSVGIILFPLILIIIHWYQKWKCNKRVKKLDRAGLIQSAGVHLVDFDESLQCKRKRFFKDFPFSKLPMPFCYACQLLLHIFLVLLPIVHIIVKLVVSKDQLGGVDILTCVLNTICWICGFKALKHERLTYFMMKAKRHSVLMLFFWAIALLLELLVFVSWNSSEWFLKNEGETVKIVNMAMFCLRLSTKTLVFVLGLHAPGLFKAKYVEKEEEKLKQSSSSRSPFADFWEKSKKLWPFVWPHNNWLRLRVLSCILLLVGGRVINVFVPIQNKKLINYLSDKHNKDDPYQLIGVYMFLVFLQGGGIGSMGLINNLRSFVWIKVQQYTSRSVQIQLFEHLHNLSLRWHLNRKTGEVIRMVDRGSTSIESLLSYILFQIVPTIADIIVAIVYFGTAFNGWFALIVFLTMMLYVVATISVTEWRTKYRRDMNIKDNATKAVAVDSLLNFETVKYYNNEAFEVKRYSEKVADYQESQWFIQMTLNVLNTSQNVIITVGLLIGMLYCGKLVISGQLTVGDFVLFLSYMRQLYMPLNFFGTYYRLIQAAFIDMENMFDLLAEKVEVTNVDAATSLEITYGLVEFRDVYFSYDERKPVLAGISFSVLPGQTVALVGPSGSGKSTIIRLLFRFYDVQDGVVLIDGQDVKKVNQKSLRQIIGVVPQDTVLFNETINYNIAYGRIGSDLNSVIDASTSADIHVKISAFPDAYETVVGERGLKLSGGEKQRVAIARTLLKAPDIILLDEATSALDTQTERNIQASLNRVCANKTTIVVAHRLSTIIGADQILVMEGGKIIERGRHHELLDMEGLYSAMWNQQLREDGGVDHSSKKVD